MAAEIDPKIIRHIASLSRIHIDVARIPELTAQFRKIIEYFDKLKELDTTGVYELTLRCKSGEYILRRKGPDDPNECNPPDRALLLPPPPVEVIELPHIDFGYATSTRPPDDNACILFYQVDGVQRIAMTPEPGNPQSDILIVSW